MEEMAKAYEPQSVEDGIYKKWEDAGCFNPDNCSGEPYAIMMPPPNVTGVLHLGHALENSLMDAMARFQRLRGKKVLLVPGTDHAALPTQAKVEKLLMQEGMTNPRKELGREWLVAKIREFADSSKATILSQVRKMGTSADWSRLAYTFDEDRNTAVNELFTRMYHDGLIYRGYRVVNWSVKGQSTSSDDEIETIERAAVLYTFKYSADFPIAIASTRPETKLGDTAVAVHPTDERYQRYVGKTFTVDVGAAQPLQITVIADENVDPAFGTGALGVTPAHSAIDFGMYEKQKAAGNPIGIVQVIGADGCMTAEAGDYEGLTVEAAREKFVTWLRANDLLESEVETVQNVGTSDRYGDVIEAIPMTQWWLDVNKIIPCRGKTLRDLMREAVTTGLGGDVTQKVNMTPDREVKLYLDRVDNLRDWCLSRQIWWGHRIPAWYRAPSHPDPERSEGEGSLAQEIYVGTQAPEGEGWTQDEDTLDTWFSSATWTFSTLGWPDKTEDLATFHPTSWMTMGYEIRYLWLMRMILMSVYALKEIPFKDVYVHGILRDKDGKKFSKSSGNGIDPIEVIKEYGCDALRLSLLTGISPGNDSKFYTEKVESSRNFVNKLWNISRFIDMSTGGLRHVESVEPDTLADYWIVERFSEAAGKAGYLMERFDFSLAAETLREFTWTDFADWYLEIAKVEKGKDGILNYILERLLILWHPFMPFVTEEIYTKFDRGMLIVASWPLSSVIPTVGGTSSLAEFEKLQNAITAIRNIRSEYKLEPKKLVDVVLSNDSLMPYTDVICALGRVQHLVVGKKPDASASAIVGDTEIAISLAGLVDVAKEKARMTEELASVEKYIAGIRARLDGDFATNAPENIVAGERAKLAEAEARREKLMQGLNAML